jgi:sugar phosphate isomerase/epimerase
MKKFSTAMMMCMIFFCQTTRAQKSLYTAPLGIEAYTFRKSFPIDVAKTLDTIRMLGFTELEGGSEGIPPEEFKKLCSERGITIPSTGADYAKLVKHPDSVVYNAKKLGAKYVMCAWIPHDKSGLSFENAKTAADDFNKAGKYLKQHGLTLCYHAHGYEFEPYQDGTLLDYIFNHTDPKYVSFEMDIFWIQFGGGDPVQLLKKYGNRWKLMHLKDLRKGTKKDLTGHTDAANDVPLGTGELDIPSILVQANKAGIRHYFIEDESDYVMTQLPQSISYLKNLQK